MIADKVGTLALQRPRGRTAQGRGAIARQAVFIPGLRDQVGPRFVSPGKKSALARSSTLTVKFVVGVFGGLILAALLWSANNARLASTQDVQQAPQDQPVTTYRAAPAREQRARGWDAEVVNSDRSIPRNFPRAVKTHRFIPPA